MLSSTVLRNIAKNKSSLQKELENIENDNKIKFYKNFLKKYNFNTLMDLVSITISDYIIAYLSNFSSESDLTFNDIGTVVLENYSIIELYNSNSMYCFFNTITKLVRLLRENQVSISYLDNDYVFNFRNDEQKKESKDYINVLYRYVPDKNCIMDMLILCDRLNTEFVDCILYAYLIKRLREDIIIIETKIDNEIYYRKLNNNKTDYDKKCLFKTAFDNYTKENYDINNLFETALQLKKDLITKVKNANKNIVSLKNEISSYEKLEAWMKKEKNNQKPLDIPSVLTTITNERLKLSVLKNIYTHNMKCHKKSEIEYKKIHLSPKIQALLKKFNLDISIDEISLNKDPKEFESMINSLLKLNIKESEKIIQILNSTNSEILNELIRHTKKGFISTNMLNENLDVFSQEGFKNYKKNLDSLINKGFSVNNINRIDVSLNLPNELLSNNIKTLEEYNLFSYRLTNSILSNTEIYKKIDFLLEHGFEDSLQEDITLLEYDIDKYKRLILLKRLNTPLFEVSKIKSVLDQAPFIIKDEEIDSYLSNTIPNITIYEIDKETFLQKLENYSFTKRTYNIDGLIISKQKVKRNMLNTSIVTSNNINNILFSNMVISYEKCLQVSNIFDLNKTFRKKK